MEPGEGNSGNLSGLHVSELAAKLRQNLQSGGFKFSPQLPPEPSRSCEILEVDVEPEVVDVEPEVVVVDSDNDSDIDLVDRASSGSFFVVSKQEALGEHAGLVPKLTIIKAEKPPGKIDANFPDADTCAFGSDNSNNRLHNPCTNGSPFSKTPDRTSEIKHGSAGRLNKSESNGKLCYNTEMHSIIDVVADSVSMKTGVNKDDGSIVIDDDDDDLPCFSFAPSASKVSVKEEADDVENEPNDGSKFDKVPKIRGAVKAASISIGQLADEVREEEERRALVSELKSWTNQPIVANSLSGDDLLPEHKAELERINSVENKIRRIHPGENIFDRSRYKSLFSYPESLSLAVCGFIPGQSVTDQTLTSLPPGDLLEFLSPDLFRIVFPAISSKDNFLLFVFYLLSISPDPRTSYRLHAILDAVLHDRLSTWTPSALDVGCVLVNYGASLSSLCRDSSLLDFSEAELNFRFRNSVCNSPVKHKLGNIETDQGFNPDNLKLVLRFVTDALAVRPENYSPQDCLSLTLIFLRLSLDRRLSSGHLNLDIQLFLAAAVNAIAPENWEHWIKEFCLRATDLTSDHHNMVHLVGLLPLVDRGMRLKRTLSLVFILKFLPEANRFDDLLNPKVRHSVNFLRALQINDNMDLYQTWSIIRLLDSSVGPDPPQEEMKDLTVMINLLHRKTSQVKDSVNKVDRILVKDQLVWFSSKLDILLKDKRTTGLFDSVVTPLKVQRLSNLPVDESEDEDNMDTLDGVVA